LICPSDTTGNGGIPPAGASSGAMAMGSYIYNLRAQGNANGGVFPDNPATKLNLSQAMPDGTSTTIIMGEQVQVCGGMGLVGNPWGTNSNRRVSGSLSLSPRALAVNVTTMACTPPPMPPPGRAAFASPHPNTLNFLMGDGSVQSCTDSVNVNTVLIPALTAAAGDEFPGF
jgi:prepilin-type processing-associated H-X9-DG protein